MNKSFQFAWTACAAVAVLLSGPSSSPACTGIRVKANDGAVVYGRTMEFGADLQSNVLIIPRNFEMQGTAPSGEPGLAWKTKYAAAGMNAQGQPILVDGVNEKGLAGGIFYFPGYAQYQEVSAADQSRALGAWELLSWVLTNFANVDEVRSAIGEVKVGDALPPGWTSAPPAHYIVHDAAGNSLVIEYIQGELHLHDNPLGVFTNAPDFDWHVTNLRNYVNLRPTNSDSLDLVGLKIAQIGQGSGLLGLPGDFTPPSRFVRAAILSLSALPQPDAAAAVEEAFHVLDSFDISLGDVRGQEAGHATYELTEWTAASDMKNCSYYFHTYNNRRLRRVDLLRADLDAKALLVIPACDAQDVEVLTPAAKDETARNAAAANAAR